ncbi:MAG TPA: Ig-like domain-containing protein [Spirillospora sp.]|nr:Ig-like domain-containing protein [Spirillospora sp.]
MLRIVLAALVLVTTACNLQSGVPTPYPTPDIPRIEFQVPANNDSFPESSEIIIILLAQDSGIGIARVELLVDDIPHSEAMPEISGAVPVFTARMNWRAEGVGYHSLTAIAYRPDGTASDPETISILVTEWEDA